MGLRTHQARVDAHKALNSMRAVMCDADDFAPDDTDTKKRSDEAKALAAAAEVECAQGRYTQAIDAAEKAMRIMEGN